MFASTPLLQQVVDKTVVSLLVAAVGGFLVWPFKTIKRKVEDFTIELKAVQTELVTQRTNCLTTIQNQGAEQIKLLNRVADTLDKTHETQMSMSGFIQGMKK
jgi:hypothetical protein